MKKLMKFLPILFLFSCTDLRVLTRLHKAPDEKEKEPIYIDDEAFPISYTSFGIPLIPIMLNEEVFPLLLDFGNSGDIQITNAISDRVMFEEIGEIATYWSDGSARGRIKRIKLAKISVFGDIYENVDCTLADWKIYSSLPFDGAIGLNYFMKKRITIDYVNDEFRISSKGLSGGSREAAALNGVRLEEPPDYFMSGIFVKGRVNGSDTIIYFDTGSSHSFIDRKMLDRDRIKKGLRNYDVSRQVSVVIGGTSFEVEGVRLSDDLEFQEYPYTVGFEIGADLLRNCIITVDRTEGSGYLMLEGPF
jgi:hypothetical protein